MSRLDRCSRRLGWLLGLHVLGCAHPGTNLNAELIARRPACMALDWGTTRPVFGLVPDSVRLNPRSGDRIRRPTDAEFAGEVESLTRSVELRGWWTWRMAGDTVWLTGWTPTMDDLSVRIAGIAASGVADWWVFNGGRGTVWVRPFPCPISRGSAA
jgi:hypothetical protein